MGGWEACACIALFAQETIIAAGGSNRQLLSHHDWSNVSTIRRYERNSIHSKKVIACMLAGAAAPARSLRQRKCAVGTPVPPTPIPVTPKQAVALNAMPTRSVSQQLCAGMGSMHLSNCTVTVNYICQEPVTHPQAAITAVPPLPAAPALREASYTDTFANTPVPSQPVVSTPVMSTPGQPEFLSQWEHTSESLSPHACKSEVAIPLPHLHTPTTSGRSDGKDESDKRKSRRLGEETPGSGNPSTRKRRVLHTSLNESVLVGEAVASDSETDLHAAL